MVMEKISQGAEAIVYKDEETVIKDRFVKTYRHPELDLKLRKARTKREVKVIQKLKELNILAPELIEKDISKITMSYIDGSKLRDILIPKHCVEVGQILAKLHDNNIIHGDLTTSNMILKEKIYLIDFGLSQFSTKVEDKAVDIHLFYQALESKHFDIYQECFENFLVGYKTSSNFKEVLSRYEKVIVRGRNKSKH